MLTIPINNKKNQPMYEQIYQYIKEEIKSNSLEFGTKLPSERKLAAHLSVSRNTVNMAYAQLLSEGYIDVYPKSGYFVNEITKPFEEGCRELPPVSSAAAAPSFLYDFSPYAVDLSHFPYHTWRQLSKRVLTDNSGLFLLGDNQGDYELRFEIAKYLHQSRGVKCRENQIIIGAGADYLLQILAGILGKDRKIAMENPAYQRACQIFHDFGLAGVPIPLDDQGMSMEELKSSGCDTAYVTPSHQYPLGIVMPIKRRMDLLNWSLTENRYIIEDDHDSEFRYKGKPIPSLSGIAQQETVIYMGTFSKAIAPAIRVGYMVLPHRLLKEYWNRYGSYASTVSRIDQAILTLFLKEGYFERHLNRMRKIYKDKHDRLTACLKDFPVPLEISGDDGGMHLVVKIKNGITEEALIQKASAHRIKLYGLKEHFIKIPSDYTPTFLFGYANLTEDEIEKGIEVLKQTCF